MGAPTITSGRPKQPQVVLGALGREGQNPGTLEASRVLLENTVVGGGGARVTRLKQTPAASSCHSLGELARILVRLVGHCPEAPVVGDIAP